MLRYVRVWHGGAIVGADNEINGITFGGVGSGTVVEHCEVAYNADDGFEFFGGTVNVKYLSALFVGDDSFDTDEGYQGKGQFLFAMVGAVGNHGTEMDSKTNGDLDSQPRSHPAWYSMTIIGGGTESTRSSNAAMRLREGTGGKFGNMVLTNLDSAHVGVEIKDCGLELVTQQLPSASTSIGSPADGALSGYLYFSANAIIDQPSTPFTFSSCGAQSFSSSDLSPQIAGGDFTETSRVQIDPRPSCGSPAYDAVDAYPDPWYESTTYKVSHSQPPAVAARSSRGPLLSQRF